MSLLRPLLLLLAFAAVPVRGDSPAAAPPTFEARLLAGHNAERTRLGIAPLVWNAQLARDAAAWARELARQGRIEHGRNRGNVGENLWIGTSGAYRLEEMVDLFVEERRHFRPGRFPEVSRTGRWSDVGHYTQLIWPRSSQLGCAVARGERFDVLVCRYAPAGNVIGETVP